MFNPSESDVLLHVLEFWTIMYAIQFESMPSTFYKTNIVTTFIETQSTIQKERVKSIPERMAD